MEWFFRAKGFLFQLCWDLCRNKIIVCGMKVNFLQLYVILKFENSCAFPFYLLTIKVSHWKFCSTCTSETYFIGFISESWQMYYRRYHKMDIVNFKKRHMLLRINKPLFIFNIFKFVGVTLPSFSPTFIQPLSLDNLVLFCASLTLL